MDKRNFIKLGALGTLMSGTELGFWGAPAGDQRRVELAGEGLRYFDIIRWRIAEDVLNAEIKSMDLDDWVDRPLDDNGNSLLPVKPVQSRIFDPNKHYVWPVPQEAIDRAKNLEQHAEWR